jgi:hypothetical protein
LGWVSVLDCDGRTIWIVDAHRGDGKRFVARSDEKLTAFLELEAAICAWTSLDSHISKSLSNISKQGAELKKLRLRL